MYKKHVSFKNNKIKKSQKYSPEEIKCLKDFIKAVQNDDSRSALAGWGNHHDYTHGY